MSAPRLTPAERQTICALARRGWSLRRIADALGRDVALSTVAAVIDGAKIPRRRYQRNQRVALSELDARDYARRRRMLELQGYDTGLMR